MKQYAGDSSSLLLLVKNELEAFAEAYAEANAKPATPSDSDPDPDLEPDSASDPDASSSEFISFPRPWHGESRFAETSKSSMKNPHASYDTSSSCHHQNLSSYLFSNWSHVSWTHSFWRICGTWLRSL